MIRALMELERNFRSNAVALESHRGERRLCGLLAPFLHVAKEEMCMATRKSLIAVMIIALSVIGSASESVARTKGGESKCSLEAFSQSDGVTITKVSRTEIPSPHCRIDGYVTTTNPGPNRVNFMLALPDKHSRRYVMTIQGGAAGFVPEPAAVQLASGYAIASTDKGTRPAHILDFNWRSDPAQSLDWAHRGVHVTALATQSLTRQYYGNQKLSRFAQGCSGGGDGTLSNAELYPEDFDGWVAAAMSTSNLEINHLWGAIAQHINHDPSAWISPEDYGRIHKVLLAKHDLDDGAADGLIWSPSSIKLNHADLPFLSTAQFGTLTLIANGLPELQGTHYPGFWLGNVTAMPGFVTGETRPPWQKLSDYPAGFMVTATGAKGFYGLDYDILKSLDYGNRAALIADRDFLAERGRYRFDPAKLEFMRKRGGKLILWSGAADQAVPPANVLEYTAALTARYGRTEREKFVRTFTVPGLHHCSTGENAPTNAPDEMLEAAARWVETNKPPTAVFAANPQRDGGNTMTGLGAGPIKTPATRSYKLCPFPQRAYFTGKGDWRDSRRWKCVEAKQL
jgi:Tannase and feruloyl esterase